VGQTFLCLAPLLGCKIEMAHGLKRQTLFCVDMPGDVVSEHFEPSTGHVMFGTSASCPVGVKLLVEQADQAIQVLAISMDHLGDIRRMHKMGASSSGRRDRDATLFEEGAHFAMGPEGVVRQQVALKRGFQEGVKAIDIVAVSGQLQDEVKQAVRGGDQVFPDSTIAARKCTAVALLRQAAQADFAVSPRPNGPTDVYGMRIDGEKGGWPSPANAQSAPQSRSISGVSKARRSAKFGRESRRGKRDFIVPLVFSQRKNLLSDSYPRSSCNTARHRISRSSTSGRLPRLGRSLPFLHRIPADLRASSRAQYVAVTTSSRLKRAGVDMLYPPLKSPPLEDIVHIRAKNENLLLYSGARHRSVCATKGKDSKQKAEG